MTEALLLVGCGGHARSLIDLIENCDQWHVLGLVGHSQQVGDQMLGYPVLGCDQDLPALRKQCQTAVVALGQIGRPTARQRLAQTLESLGFVLPAVVSRHANVSRHASLGAGTSVGHGVIVNAGARVGNHCILNSRPLIEHDAVIEDHCHISTGPLINGGVTLGEESFIGSGAMLRAGLTIPAGSVISAGKRVMGWPLLEAGNQ